MVNYREGNELIDIDGEVIHETEMAYLFDAGGKDAVWVPKSVCEWDPDGKKMTMKQWIAKDKELI